MEFPEFSTRHNAMNITSIQSFAGIKGGFSHGRKDVYFIRCVGVGSSYAADIEGMDRQLSAEEQSGGGGYIRVRELPRLASPEDIALYTGIFDKWENSGNRNLSLETVSGDRCQEAVNRALKETLARYRICQPGATGSMEKNFVIKLMFWADHGAGNILKEWNGKSTGKFVYSGSLKKQEYLFFYFLTLLGIDVLLLLPEGDAALPPELKQLSALLVLGECARVTAPAYVRPAQKSGICPAQTGGGHKVNIQRTTPRKSHAGVRIPSPARPPRQERRELAFEELALLASSVVMITVCDPGGKITSTGSGIMVGRNGYILTNNHVASGGMSYSVRIEGDETLYQTDEMIKYNQMLDLAVIRIDRTLKPVPVYGGEKPLARGQRVVAIGSPLGLFNSVSDGIISGFRKINEVDMIQFTAPISHGSSGGAVFNMYGDVIGISTAGFDGGQNINLAVDYQCIGPFIRGFV